MPFPRLAAGHGTAPCKGICSAPQHVCMCAKHVALGVQGHERAGATGRAHASLRWAADYLMACHTAPNEFVGQVRPSCRTLGAYAHGEVCLALVSPVRGKISSSWASLQACGAGGRSASAENHAVLYGTQAPGVHPTH